MNSSTSRAKEEQTKQAEIRRQIAILQAQLDDTEDAKESLELPGSPKRKRDSNVLVPPTPSPKKRRKVEETRGSSPSRKAQLAKRPQPPQPNVTKPVPSTLLSKMASLSQTKQDKVEQDIIRSAAFSDAPAPRIVSRDERLAIIEELEPGPLEHTPPADDPEFSQLEPNSGIRLSSRSLSHEDLQNHLTGRYYLSPSLLYSCIRLHPNKQSFDVPVYGDWITIAVVAERGPIKFTRAPVAVEKIPDEKDEEKKNFHKKGKESKPKPPMGKKYVNIKLVDFGARSKSPGQGGKAVIRGDAFLTLLLFESDGYDTIQEADGRERRMYKGGSKGAFESMSKLKEGDVVAMLNPKVLKPFQSTNDKPHPVTNVLAVTPESASSIIVIGRSRDLGMCVATKKDGKICGNWCDKRIADICEWHMQNAVKSRRAARPEFAVGTSGMSNSAVAMKRKSYDPARQWGLKPEGSVNRAREEDGGGSTYVVSGHIVDSSTLFMSENMGREAQARAARKKKDTEAEIQELLRRDKGGKLIKGNSRLLKGQVEECQDKDEQVSGKSRYSASMIRHLGFDPVSRAGLTCPSSGDVQRRKLEMETILTSRKSIQLGPRPGKSLTSVRPPIKPSGDQARTSTGDKNAPTSAMIDLDE